MKYSLKNLQQTYTNKLKNNRTSTARTPKNLDSTIDHKTIYNHKFHSQTVKTHR